MIDVFPFKGLRTSAMQTKLDILLTLYLKIWDFDFNYKKISILNNTLDIHYTQGPKALKFCRKIAPLSLPCI